MIPFMKPKQIGSIIQMKHQSDGSTQVEKEEGGHDPGLLSVAEDLIQAIHAKDAVGVADALAAHQDMQGMGFGEVADE